MSEPLVPPPDTMTYFPAYAIDSMTTRSDWNGTVPSTACVLY